MYTQSLSNLGKKDRAGSRKKSSGEHNAEKMVDAVETEEAESTPTSKTTELESIPDAEVKDEEVDGSKSLAAAGEEEHEEEEGEERRPPPPPPSVVVTSEPQEDVEMEVDEPSVDGDKPQDDEEDEEDEGSDEEEADVTRCVCGITGGFSSFF